MWLILGGFCLSFLFMARHYERRLDQLRNALGETEDRVRTLEMAIKKMCLEVGISEPPLGTIGELTSKMVDAYNKLKEHSAKAKGVR